MFPKRDGFEIMRDKLKVSKMNKLLEREILG